MNFMTILIVVSILFQSEQGTMVLKTNPNTNNSQIFCEKMIKNHFKIDNFLAISFSKTYYSLKIDIIKFNSFSQIQFNCIDSSFNEYLINFIPNTWQVLDSSLNFDFNDIELRKSSYFVVNFLHIKWFKIDSNIFEKISSFYGNVLVNFFYSKMISDSNNCGPVSQHSAFFRKILTLKFSFSTKYFTQTCPRIFQNSTISFLYLYGLSDAFLKKNILSFSHLNETIQSKIEYLELKAYRLTLTSSLLSKNVFNNVKALCLKGLFESIDRNSIESLSNLELIYMESKNLISSLANDPFWLNSLITNKTSKYLILRVAESVNLQITDQEVCLAKDFMPNEKLLIYLGNKNCSCFMVWLLRNRVSNMSFLDRFYQTNIYKLQLYNFIDYSLVCGNLDSKMVESCQFEKKFNQCHKASKLVKIYDEEYFLYITEFLNFITIVFTPVVSLVGLATNFFAMVNLFKLIKLRIPNKMNFINKQMLVNVTINLFYFLFFLLHLINKCVYVNGVYCSFLKKNYYAQLFDIIFYEFFMSNLKAWSNITIVMISWSRLSFLSRGLLDRNSKISNRKNKILALVFIFLSFVLSLDKFFYIKINSDFFVMDDKDYEEFPNKNTFQITLYSDRSIQYVRNKSIIFYVYFTLSFILNDFLFYALMVLMDFMMVRQFRKNLSIKKLVESRISCQKLKNNVFRAEYEEARITSIVFVNLFVLLCLKFFHLGISTFILYDKISNYVSDKLCLKDSRICTNLAETAEIIYSLSNILTIVLFYGLDRNFREKCQNSLRIFFEI